MKNKKITLVGVNYYPEDTAIGLYSTQMAEYLRKKGGEVNVITGFPYYPQWQIRKEYRSRGLFVKEESNGVLVYRYKQYVPKKPSFLKRIIHLVDFTFGSLFNVLKIKECDMVIAIVPFTSAIFLGWVLKLKTKAKLWVHVQDFEFDAALQTGMTTNKSNGLKKMLFDTLFRLEKWMFSKADMASSISYTMLDKLKTKTTQNTKIHYFPNWIDPDKINPATATKHPYLNSDKFNILYSGNIGDKQDWDVFISFVEMLDKNKYEVTIVGDGAKKEWLINEIKPWGHVKYFPPVPFEELSSLLCSADLHILFQKQDVIDTVMPSKLLGMMASAKPSLVTGNHSSEVKRVFDESNGGLYSANNDINELLTFVETIYGNKGKTQTMGIDARNFVINKFSKDLILDSFITHINPQQ